MYIYIYIHINPGSICELYGSESEPRVLEPLPKQIRSKLKTKLTEFGGCIHRQKKHVEKLKTTDIAFPTSEQLNPGTPNP
jgi:hypothetical protein